MEKKQLVRWEQRLANYAKALAQLDSAVKLSSLRNLSELEKQGLIQAIEFTHELAWNVMKDYFAYQGNPSITGSRDAVRESFNKGLIIDGEGWMAMIASRNQTSHTYNLQVANEIVEKIIHQYAIHFDDFLHRMQQLANQQ